MATTGAGRIRHLRGHSRFGGRAGLLEALYQRAFALLTDALGTVPVTEDPIHDLRELAYAYRDFALAAPQRYLFMFSRPLPDFEPTGGDRKSTRLNSSH